MPVQRSSADCWTSCIRHYALDLRPESDSVNRDRPVLDRCGFVTHLSFLRATNSRERPQTISLFYNL